MGDVNKQERERERQREREREAKKLSTSIEVSLTTASCLAASEITGSSRKSGLERAVAIGKETDRQREIERGKLTRRWLLD